MKTVQLIMLAAVAALAAVITLGGCEKTAPPYEHKHEHEAAAPAGEATSAAASIEQTTCPVMDGMKINKNVFTEYKSKKVYFCCADCKAKFEAEPEKYLAKLPQFQK